MPSSIADAMSASWLAKSKLVRKPREPKEKDKTGGTILWKSQDVNRTVPSPPSYGGI